MEIILSPEGKSGCLSVMCCTCFTFCTCSHFTVDWKEEPKSLILCFAKGDVGMGELHRAVGHALTGLHWVEMSHWCSSDESCNDYSVLTGFHFSAFTSIYRKGHRTLPDRRKIDLLLGFHLKHLILKLAVTKSQIGTNKKSHFCQKTCIIKCYESGRVSW